MRTLLVKLFRKFGMDRLDACADDKALYIEVTTESGVKYIKLVPSEVTVEEYNEAWDWNDGNET